MHSRAYSLIRASYAGGMVALLSVILLLGITVGVTGAYGAAQGFAETPRWANESIIDSSMAYTSYLPGVFSFPPPPPRPIIYNGNFELGPVDWSEYSTTGQRLILSAADLPIAPYSGSWAASLGNQDYEVSMLSQAVTIPVDYACLVYWQWIISSDSCNADYGGVGVNGTWFSVQSLCAGTSTAQWVRQQVSMTKTAATPIVLNFAVANDYSFPSTMYVDDISFQPTAQCAKPGGASLHTTEVGDLKTEMMVGQPIKGRTGAPNRITPYGKDSQSE